MGAHFYPVLEILRLSEWRFPDHATLNIAKGPQPPYHALAFRYTGQYNKHYKLSPVLFRHLHLPILNLFTTAKHPVGYINTS